MASFGELLGQEIREARETRGWTQLALAERAYADANYERRIRDYETGRVHRPQARVYQPLCDALQISRQQIGVLKECAGDTGAINIAEIEELRVEKGSLQQALSELKVLSRNQLETLAVRFEIARSYDIEDADLFDLLEKKSEEYLILRTEIESIDANMIKLSGLKNSARDAIEVGDLERVERLLEKVHVTEKEEIAKTGELRARNALLRGRIEQAYSLFEDAANEFAVIDPLKNCHRRADYSEILKKNAMHFGGNANMFRVQLLEDAYESAYQILQGDHATKSSAATAMQMGYQYGLALIDFGFDKGLDEGEGLISKGLTALNGTYEMVKEAGPVDLLAIIQRNVGITLSRLAQQTPGATGLEYFEKSLEWLAAASKNFAELGDMISKSDVDSMHTLTARNLALRSQPENQYEAYQSDVESNRLLVEKVKNDADSRGTSSALHRLGMSQAVLGKKVGGQRGIEILTSAIEHLEEARSLRSQREEPKQLANILGNLATTYDTLCDLCDGPNRELLEQKANEYFAETISLILSWGEEADVLETRGNYAHFKVKCWMQREAADPEAMFEAIETFQQVIQHHEQNGDQISRAKINEKSALAHTFLIMKRTDLITQSLIESALGQYRDALSVFDAQNFPENRKRILPFYEQMLEAYEAALV